MQRLKIVRLGASALIAGFTFLNSSAADTVVRRPAGDVYLEWDGAVGGVNTGYYPTPKTKIVADYRIISNGGTRFLYGAESAGDGVVVGHYWQRNQQQVDRQSMTTGNGDIRRYPFGIDTDGLANARYQSTFDLKNLTFSVYSQGVKLGENTLKESDMPVASTSTVPLVLFTNMKSNGTFGSGNNISARIYSLAIYDDDVLVRDYVAYGCGAVTGLLDRCTGKVVEPIDGNGAVAKGHYKLGIDPGYAESGAGGLCQYVDTGVIVDTTTKIDVEFTSLSSAGPQSIFGTGAVGDEFVCNFRSNSKGQYVWDFQDDENLLYPTGIVADGADYRVIIDGPGGTIQLYRGTKLKYEATLGDPSTRTKRSVVPLALFSHVYYDANGKVADDARAYARIRSAKIWENSVLVRDYEPRVVDNVAGLYDTVNGTFAKAYHSVTPVSEDLSCGGAVTCTSENGVGAEACLDAYVESDGGYVETDYYPNETTRVEAEIAPARIHTNTSILGCDLFWWFQQNDNHMFVAYLPGKTYYLGAGAYTAARWFGYIDFTKGKATFSVGGQTRAELTFPVNDKLTAQYPLLFFGCRDQGKIAKLEKSRIYGVSIYEYDVLVRNYQPCMIDGVVGFWETCNGKFWPNSSTSGTLKFRGAGVNGEGLVFTDQPKSCKLRRVPGRDTLVAFAPTAIGYQWYKDGEPIAGATHSSLDVAWEGAKPPRVHTYSCKAFFALEGTADSNEAIVSSNPPGMLIEIR